MNKSKILFSLLGILILASLVTGLTFYYKLNLDEGQNEDINVMVVINYGTLLIENEETHNVTTKNGTSALEVFLEVAILELTNYSLGVYIKGVNGYSEQLPDYWAFYYYDYGLLSWMYSEVGVSNFLVEADDKIKLQYTG
jgi:hypothetical protein